MVDWGILLGLTVLILVVYTQVNHFEFTSYDDPEYVTENPLVQAGLTAASFQAAWTAVAVGNWIPITVLSHIADGQFFGMESGAHHMVNVALHALAAMLLFAALRRATQARWPSAFVAALFAVHPLHVESVAWISERKDVLSAFFAFLALYFYVRYAERESVRGYLMVAAAFVLGLMSKPMLVTFPFLLLLIDFWPLGRAHFPKLLWEKAPLVALSAADSLVTYLVQGTAVQAIPFDFRLRVAAVAPWIYIREMFWPAGLAVFYPLHSVAGWQAAMAALMLAAVSALVVYSRRAYPYLAVGWFWFLGTLVPVVGMVQVGAQAHADRYTYIPMVGLLIMLAWGAVDVLQKWPAARKPVIGLAAVGGILCMVLASRQAGFWENSGTLFQHAIEVTRDNYVAQSGLGSYLAQTGRKDEAVAHFEEVVRLVPDDSRVHNNLGILYAGMPGHQQQAVAHFEAAIRKHPDYMEAQYNLGLTLAQMAGRRAEAISHLEAAQRLQPSAHIEQMIDRLRSGEK
jgi:tetratricopeptide (TPR) repeat protein